MRQLSSVNGNTVCPKMIVVGIPNTNRMRDLTPTTPEGEQFYIDSSASTNSGGGEKFISFIEKELIPHIESNYPTQPYRMLIGHSLGGLMVMHALKLLQFYLEFLSAMVLKWFNTCENCDFTVFQHSFPHRHRAQAGRCGCIHYNYNAVLPCSLLTRVTWDYRQEQWWPLLTSILTTALR